MAAAFAGSRDLIVWRHFLPPAASEGQLFPGAVAVLLIAAAVVTALAAHRASGARDGAAWRILRVATLAVAAGFAVVAACLPLSGPWSWRAGSWTVASATYVNKPLSVTAALIVLAAISTPAVGSAWRRQSALAFYTCASAATLVLCFGPRPTLAGIPVLHDAPYAWLMELPGFSEVRVPARFGMLFILCVAVAAAIAFARLTAIRPPFRRRLLAAAAIGAVLIESWPRVTLAAPPVPIAALDGIDGRTPVLELPLGIVERDIAAMYR